jgi:hypothetical protein
MVIKMQSFCFSAKFLLHSPPANSARAAREAVRAKPQAIHPSDIVLNLETAALDRDPPSGIWHGTDIAGAR